MKRTSLFFVVLSMISLSCYIGTVAYNWGYMQSAIDNRVAAFSAPASAAVFSGIPFIIATIIFAVIAIVVYRRK
ncbi:MAG: hypothetical protein RR964_09955 [Lachnospiraceae bacterium]